MYAYLTEATIGTPSEPGMTMKLLLGLGFDGNFDNLAQLIGKPVKCQNKHEEYEGETRDKWTIFAPSSPRTVAAPQSEARRLTSTLGSFFKKDSKDNRPSSPKRPKPKQEAVAADNGNDLNAAFDHTPQVPPGEEIPF